MEVGRVVAVGSGVRVAVGNGVLVAVGRGVNVLVGGGVTEAVGGEPARANVPEACQEFPMKIWTSYGPSCHIEGSCPQSVTPMPDGKAFQEVVSMCLS